MNNTTTIQTENIDQETTYAQNVNEELKCKHSTQICLTNDNCKKCPHMTIIFAEHIDEYTFSTFIDVIDMIQGEHLHCYGYCLTEALKLYRKTAKQYKIDNLIEKVNHDMYTSRKIIVSNICPKLHFKFIKYLQEKYTTENIKEHYNRELNTAISIYLRCVLLHKAEHIIIKEYDLGEISNLYRQCVVGGTYVRELF